MNRYESKRVFATAPDKTQIPISIVHRRDLYVVHEIKMELSQIGDVAANDGCLTRHSTNVYIVFLNRHVRAVTLDFLTKSRSITRHTAT